MKEPNPDKSHVPRREFLKYSGLLTAGAAYAVYLTTDAKGQQAVPMKSGGADSTSDDYNYISL